MSGLPRQAFTRQSGAQVVHASTHGSTTDAGAMTTTGVRPVPGGGAFDQAEDRGDGLAGARVVEEQRPAGRGDHPRAVDLVRPGVSPSGSATESAPPVGARRSISAHQPLESARPGRHARRTGG
jgi:hypothetical protein